MTLVILAIFIMYVQVEKSMRFSNKLQSQCNSKTSSKVHDLTINCSNHINRIHRRVVNKFELYIKLLLSAFKAQGHC